MAKYSVEKKEAAMKKLLPPINMSVAAVAAEEGVSEQTLYNWRDKARQSGVPVPGKKPTTLEWSAETKFAVVVETATFSASQLSQYCREKGLYPEQVSEWRDSCLSGFQTTKEQERAAKKQAKADRSEIKFLKKELRYKESALAETAALLVLRKKLRALYGEDDEES
jgi:transposase-like protein